jgi:hypothetical protein
MALIDTAAATDGFSFPVRAGFVSERLRSVRGMSIGSVTYLRPIGGVKGGPTGRVSEAGWEVAAILRRPPIFFGRIPVHSKKVYKREMPERQKALISASLYAIMNPIMRSLCFRTKK